MKKIDVDLDLEPSWKFILGEEFEKPYFRDLLAYIETSEKKGETIYPPEKLRFKAFDLTPLDEVKVVIIGQDPYHGLGQAMGLSFSVPMGIKVPASLKRIYKELNRDIGISIPLHGDLTAWAQQGVLLLNAMLTVEAGNPGSHKKIGWQEFTDTVIKKISDHKQCVIFMLWGNFAKSKRILINNDKHHVLEATHPSPLAGNVFSGCAHFSMSNKILRENNLSEIDWQL